MKILIGITQDLDAVKKSLHAQYKGLGASTEAGPFKTRDEAMNWQNFMMNRRDNYEEIKVDQAPGGDAYWFGLTVESNTLQ
jgi:hypothetical protein